MGLGVLVLASLWQALEGLVAESISMVALDGDNVQRIRDHLFWLVSLPVLVLSYTTFESFYRGRDSRFLSMLPIDGRGYLNSVMLRAYLLHLPLFLPAGFYSALYLAHGATALGVYGGLWSLLTFAMAVPLSLAMHVGAGNAGLGGASRLKGYLASGVISNDSAFLLYSPVAALAATISVGIFSDLVLFETLITGRADLLWGPIAWSLLIAVVAWRKALVICEANFFPMVAKFREADIPLSYGDDGIPIQDRRLLFASLPRGTSALYFERDDKQLRRRYRLDKILVGAFALVLLRFNAGAEPETSLADTCLIPLLGFVALLLVPSFRTHGEELDSPWLRDALPHSGPARWWGGFLADLVYPFWAWVLAVLFAFIYGPPAEAALVAGLGLVSSLALVAAARLAASTGDGSRAGLMSVAWRLSCMGVIGVALWQQ